jgi:hypothetical protein
MNLRDVLRRFRLPRIASFQNRTGETEDAINLARILGERFSVGSEGVRFASRSAYRNSWVDWRDSLRELGVELRHIGRRGHASLKNGKQVLIRLDSGQWQVQQGSLDAWEIVARDWGRESLRAYLIKDGPPRHPLFEKR